MTDSWIPLNLSTALQGGVKALKDTKASYDEHLAKMNARKLAVYSSANTVSGLLEATGKALTDLETAGVYFMLMDPSSGKSLPQRLQAAITDDGKHIPNSGYSTGMCIFAGGPSIEGVTKSFDLIKKTMAAMKTDFKAAKDSFLKSLKKPKVKADKPYIPLSPAAVEDDLDNPNEEIIFTFDKWYAFTLDTLLTGFTNSAKSAIKTSRSELSKFQQATDNLENEFNTLYAQSTTLINFLTDMESAGVYRIMLAPGVGGFSTRLTSATNYPASGNLTYTAGLAIVGSTPDLAALTKSWDKFRALVNIDLNPPEFKGISAINLGASKGTSIKLDWLVATDDVTDKPEDFQYQVYWDKYSAVSGDVSASGIANHLSNLSGSGNNYLVEGINTYTVNNLIPATDYYFLVRARDKSGKLSTITDTERMPPISHLMTADTISPIFSGLSYISSGSPASGGVQLHWNSATDNQTLGPDIKYAIYSNSSVLGVLNDIIGIPGPNPKPEFARRYLTVSTTGATSYQVSGMVSGAPTWWGVRAIDASGNIDSNTAIWKGYVGQDFTLPTFNGVVSAVSGNPASGSVILNWASASGGSTLSSEFLYAIYAASGYSAVSGMMDSDTRTATTTAGVTAYALTGFNPSNIWFGVRAIDSAGGRDTNFVAASADVFPPTFAGVSGVNAVSATGCTLNWGAATDNLTPTGSIVYKYYKSTDPNTVFTSLLGTTIAGATSKVITGLTTATTYWFGVRAVDVVGNIDSNTIIKSVTTS